MRRMSTNPSEYVVLDIETNGLGSKRDDLLSISFYKPDDGKEYNKFLPLELNRKIVTSHINGITKKDLVGATALTQREYERIVEEFELEERIVLFYAGGDFDNKFIKQYMRRHGISGFDKLKFYNFKKNIVSSKYSDGNITKDNLCTLFKIDGVKDTHNSLNDCKLEWKLFEKMDGYFYLVTEGEGEDNVFRLNEDYIIPASLLCSHPNLSRILCDRPYIECQSIFVKSFEIDARGIEKFQNDITGMTIENLINSMLNVDKQNSREFLLKNKMKLDFIGKIPNEKIIIPMVFNLDGTVTVIHEQDKEMEKSINFVMGKLKEQISPLIDFIKCEIFKNERILSQELVIDSENNMLALCDLSSEKTVLEIKTTYADSMVYKEQFFYEAQGRDVYHLKMKWEKDTNTNLFRKIILEIVSVDVHIGTPKAANWFEGKRVENKAKKIAEIQKHLSSSNLSLVSFKNTGEPIKLQCKECGYERTIRYSTLMKKIPTCIKCTPKITRKKQTKVSKEEQIKLRAERYSEKVLQKSNHTIVAMNYIGSKENVDAICVVCGNKWRTRADHLLDRCWCSICKKNKQ